MNEREKWPPITVGHLKCLISGTLTAVLRWIVLLPFYFQHIYLSHRASLPHLVVYIPDIPFSQWSNKSRTACLQPHDPFLGLAHFWPLNPRLHKLFYFLLFPFLFFAQLLLRNFTRVRRCIMVLINAGCYINSCFEWDSPQRSICAFVVCACPIKYTVNVAYHT